MEELEALMAILEEETVEVVTEEGSDKPEEISIKINPLTEGEQEKQYVSLTLVISLSNGYPANPPQLGVRNPRGLEDSAVAGLLADMNNRCEEYVGCPVLFELIEMAREFLTVRNVPVVRCIICLNNIQEDDAFMKTECLHFFHKHCLGRYITNMQETYEEQKAEALSQNSNITFKDFVLTCPVCRETIGESRYNLAELLGSAVPISAQDIPDNPISDEIKKMQQKMKRLYLKQQAKGGIIDLEAEQKKFLVVTGGSEDSEEKFTELSPTDYQLDDSGFPCAKPTPPASPARTLQGADTGYTGDYETSGFHQYSNYNKGGFRKGRGGHGRGHYNRHQSSEDNPDARDARNAYRKNHYLNRGKSHHQQKKGKSTGGPL